MATVDDRDAWTAKIHALEPGAPVPQRIPLSRERIVAAAFELVAAEGFESVTMRRVASALGTGAASLYAHVRNKAELDELMIGRVCAAVEIPAVDPARWTDQLLQVCRSLRDGYLRYPGISRVALSSAPNSLEALRLAEAMLTILLAGGVPARQAAWAIDAAFLYVSAYCFEVSLRHDPDADEDQRLLDRDEVIARYRMLPVETFPSTVAHAEQLTSGVGHERFDFALRALLGGLTVG